MGLSILYVKGLQKFLNYDIFLSLKVVLILANSADSDEIQHYGCISSRSSLFANIPI